jgi:hypothetical protein
MSGSTDHGINLRKHATRMFQWEDQVATDAAGRRQATAIRAVSIVRRKVDRDSGMAEIDQRWLAGQLGVSVRGLQKAIDWLVVREHIIVHVRKHLRMPNLYEPIIKTKRTSVRFETVEKERGFVVDTKPDVGNSRTGVHTNSDSSSKTSPRYSRPMATFADRGRYEIEIANRIGAPGMDVLAALSEPEIDVLVARQKANVLSDQMIEDLRVSYWRNRTQGGPSAASGGR